MTATNGVGTGPASAASNTFFHPGAPAPPTIGVATAGNGSASVAFTPGFNGGSGVTRFDAACTSANGGDPANGFDTASPIVVTGLMNGFTYTCTVTATSTLGTSVASAASNPVVFATTPMPPTITTVTPGNASATVAFTPGVDGGDPVLQYFASCVSSDGGASFGLFSGSSSPILVQGLSNGNTYTCTVQASNSHGLGPKSAPSPSFVVSLIPGVPGPPVPGLVVQGDGNAALNFTAGNPGSAPILDYTVSCSSTNGGVPGSGTDIASPVFVFGLTNGRTYTCAVSERNSFGSSLLSPRTHSFVVGVVPPAPRSPVAVPGNGGAKLTWSAPSERGRRAGDGLRHHGVPRPDRVHASHHQLDRDQHDDDRTHERQDLHVPGRREERNRHRREVGCNGRSADRVADASESRHRGARQRPRHRVVADAAERQRRPAHRLHRDSVRERHPQAGRSRSTTPRGSRRSSVSATARSTRSRSTALNKYGKGAQSVASPVITIGVPQAPTGAHLTQGPSDSLKLTYIAPLDNGAPVTKYTATCISLNGGATQTKTSTFESMSIKTPTRHRVYTCTVTATNSRGTGRPSSASNAVTVA